MRIIVETVLLIILSIAIVAMAVVLVIVLSKNKNNNINDAIYDASKKLNQDTVNSVKLLDKTRKINRLLHNNNSSKVVFNDICEVLNEILASNVLVVSKKGKVLGSGQWKDVEVIHELIDNEVGSHIDEMLNERLLSILSTKENVNLQTLGFSPEVVKGYQAIVTPIDIAGERLGTLFIYKKDELYEIDDIILSEYGTTVVGLRWVIMQEA